MNREITSHLILLQDDFERQGMQPGQARLAARRAYGGVEQARELHRAERSIVWLEQLLQDIRHACRTLTKSPVFLMIAVISMAFGIGVNTAIFTLVNSILLKTLPVPDPHRIVQVQAHVHDFTSSGFSFPTFRVLRRQTDIFADVAGFSGRTAVLDLDGESSKVNFEMITGSYFQFFGAHPVLGRLLDEEDDQVEGARPVCVISYPAWQSYFRGDPQVLDRTVRVDGVLLQVVGVAGPDFVGAELQQRYDIWTPTAMVADFSNPREMPFWVWLHILARLKPEISQAEAAARLESVSPSIEEALPKQRVNAGATYQIQDASRGFDTWRSSLRQPLFILMGAVFLVLLVACANLTNLLLARASDRHKEFAIKLSLGISRRRLLRQLLVETLLLALGGGLAGILLAFTLTKVLLDLFNAGSNYRDLYVAPDRAVLLFTLAACALTALISGLYPAWHGSRTDVGAGLKGASLYGLRRSFVRRGLILIQVTLAIVLLFGASLFAHSLRRLKTVELGYDIDRVLTVEIGQRGPKSTKLPASVAPAALEDVLGRVRGLPNVESAALCNPGLLSGGMMARTLTVKDALGVERTNHNVHFVLAGPGYLSTLRIALLRGRDFEATDRAGSALVAIVNQSLAAQLWPGEDPVGKHIDGWGKNTGLEVIGVVANTKYQNVREETKPIVYQAFEQSSVFDGTLEVRCRGQVGQIERDVREIVNSAAPNYQVTRAASMELLRDSGIAQDRLLAFLSSLFGALGTVLSLVGIYGLISYSVSRRTREVGVRMSLGARPSAVLWLFLREVTILMLSGIVLGSPLALTLARFARAMLFEVSTHDPVGITATIVLLGFGGLFASLVPARRATRVNPVQALRYE